MGSELDTSASWISRDPIASVREEVYGAPSTMLAAAAAGVPGAKPVLFSYALPEQIKQAKMESLQYRTQQSIMDVMARLSSGKSLAMQPSTLEISGAARTSDAGSHAGDAHAYAAEKGGIDQFTAFVQPPQIEEDGRELNASSRLIMKGRKQNYQHLKPASKMRGVVNVDYGMPGPEEPVTPAPRQASGYGLNRSAGSPQRRLQKQISASGPGQGAGAIPGRAAAEQLRHSMTISFVPVNVSTEGLPSKALASSSPAYDAARDEVDRLRASTTRSQSRSGMAQSSATPQSSTWKGFVNGAKSAADASVTTITEENLSVVLKTDGYQLQVEAKERAVEQKKGAGLQAREDGAVGQSAGAAGPQAEGAADAAGPGLGQRQDAAQGNTGQAASPSGQHFTAPGTSTTTAATAATTATAVATAATGAAIGMQAGSSAANSSAGRGLQALQAHLAAPAWPTAQGLGASASAVPTSIRPRAQSAQPSRTRAATIGQHGFAQAGWTGGAASLTGRDAIKTKGATMLGSVASGAVGAGLQTGSLATQQMAASERLSCAKTAGMVPTHKTMARCRSGRLFSQSDKNAALFSAPTPTVAEIQAMAMTRKREDLQYRILEYRGWQIQSSSPMTAQTQPPPSGEAGGAGVAAPGHVRPESAPLMSMQAGQSLEASALGVPPRPFSAMPLRSASYGARPMSAMSTWSATSSRPQSAAASAAGTFKRVRPPSAGAWAGRPRSAAAQSPPEMEATAAMAVGPVGWNNSTRVDAVHLLTAAGIAVPLAGP